METATPVDQLQAIIEFRKDSIAPVDTMGSSKVGDKGDEKLYRFQTLVGLMLSAQTKDEITSQAVDNLKKGIKGGLTPYTLSKQSPETIQELIKKVSFFRRKSERIIEAAQVCVRDYDGDIPRSLKELTALNGVGIKMATLAMSAAWHEQIGIGVDVHVHRISNRLHWVKTKHPDDTELELQKVFPKELWEPLNEALVGFGQTICNAKKPKCDLCPIMKSCPLYNQVDDDETDEEETSSQKKKPKKAPKTKPKKSKGQKRKSRDYSESDIEDFNVESEKEATSSDFSSDE